MKTKRRWLISVLDDTAKADTKMPWTRGRSRADMIAKRISACSAKTVASA